MQTATIICPDCHGQIAVSRDDLGHHVQCPLCHKVILAQVSDESAPATAISSIFEPIFDTGKVQDHESIFAPPEASDDLFGEVTTPRLELSPSRQDPTVQLDPFAEPEPASKPPSWAIEETLAIPAPEAAPQPTIPSPVPEKTLPWQGPGVDAVTGSSGTKLSAPASEVMKRAARESALAPLLLIFLIPYAIFSTACIGWLLWTQSGANQNPLEMLPDPSPRDGPAKRIQHDAPLSPKQRTNLNQPLDMGDVQVKPLKVELRPEGDLVLHLHVKNLSRDTQFTAVPDSFGRWKRETQNSPRPYTFVELGGKRAYGCDVQWWRGGANASQQLRSGMLKPGEEMTAVLITDPKDRPQLAGVEHSTSPLLWRVHVRRGLVQVRSKDVSATCVIGVQFNAADIRRIQPPAPDPDDG